MLYYLATVLLLDSQISFHENAGKKKTREVTETRSTADEFGQNQVWKMLKNER